MSRCFPAPLPLAIALILSPLALQAQTSTVPPPDPRHHGTTNPHADDLGTVVVKASLLGNAVAKPESVLAGERLDEARSATLGETVNAIAGVQSSNFGAGVGRPIIRGQDGPRVAVMSNGMASQDVSTVSQDHAPAVESFLADQIEVLKGPSTLLFGSGAIGGAVNIVDGRVPERQIVDGVSGRTELRYDTGSHGNTGLFRIDGGNQHFTVHADGVRRDMGDYKIPGGVQANSYVRAGSGSLGASALGDWGFVGVNASRYMTTYGNPGEPGDREEGESGVRVQMRQERTELRGGMPNLWNGGGLRFSLAHTDYKHVEFENDSPGTTFLKKADEGRIEANTAFGAWKLAAGLQMMQSRFNAIGEEAFVPSTRTRSTGVFVVARTSTPMFDAEVGLRGDQVNLKPVDGAEARYRPLSGSIGGAWKFAPGWRLTLNLDHAQRAPAEEELFADGPHIATLAYEVGQRSLRRETANQIDLGVKYIAPRFDAAVNIYRNRMTGFIYLADTPDVWYWDEEERELPVRRWNQADAVFKGAEADLTWHLTPEGQARWDLRAYGDVVRGTLASGDPLPRIAPGRAGLQLRFEQGPWRASAGGLRVMRQSRVAPGETPTPGYTSLDAHLAYHHDGDGWSWELFGDGRNLSNQVQRVHTSFLKDDVVLPGRSFSLGWRAYF